MQSILTLVATLFFFLTGKAQERQLVFKHVTVINMTSSLPKRDQTVVISGNQIVMIGPSSSVRIPQEAQVVNASGNYLIPGLWDAHVHLAKAGENSLTLFIANGITSVRDMGGDPVPVLQWKKEIAAETRVGPRIKTAGPILESSSNVERMKQEGTIEPVARSRVGIPDSIVAAAIIDSVIKLGVDFLKVRTVASPATYQAIAQAARNRGFILTGHAVASPYAIIEAGQRSIEHSFLPSLNNSLNETERKNLFKRLSEEDIYVVPTLVTGRTLLVDAIRATKIVEDQLGKIDDRRKYLSGYLIDDWREQVAELSLYPSNLNKILADRVEDLREMQQANVRFMAGTDVAVALIYPGFSLHEELQLMVEEIGMTPMQALLSATRYPAEFLNIQASLGTIEVGKMADLVLLQANPLNNIKNTQKIRGVVANGHYFPKKVLRRLLADIERKNKP